MLLSYLLILHLRDNFIATFFILKLPKKFYGKTVDLLTRDEKQDSKFMIDDIDRVCHETAGPIQVSDGPIRWSFRWSFR